MLQTTSEATVGLATLVRDTGERVRTIQNWTDAGVLRPTISKRGKGYHRAFSSEPFYGERAFALLASALGSLRVPHHEMALITNHLRKRIKSEAARDARAFAHSPFARAMVSDEPCLMLVRVDEAAKRHEQIRLRLMPAIRPGMLQVTEGGFTARSPSPEEIMRLAVEFLAQCKGRAHILDLAAVFAPLRALPRSPR
jgi:hypothetical protein